jgi:hypothetical protein
LSEWCWRKQSRLTECRMQVAWVYTLFMATLMGLLVGVTQRVLGSPGDLPEVVHQIHTSGRIAISQAPSMFVCSAFSIAAGRASRYTP